MSSATTLASLAPRWCPRLPSPAGTPPLNGRWTILLALRKSWLLSLCLAASACINNKERPGVALSDTCQPLLDALEHNCKMDTEDLFGGSFALITCPDIPVEEILKCTNLCPPEFPCQTGATPSIIEGEYLQTTILKMTDGVALEPNSADVKTKTVKLSKQIYPNINIENSDGPRLFDEQSSSLPGKIAGSGTSLAYYHLYGLTSSYSGSRNCEFRAVASVGTASAPCSPDLLRTRLRSLKIGCTLSFQELNVKFYLSGNIDDYQAFYNRIADVKEQQECP